MITPSQMDPKSSEYFLIEQLENEIDNAVKTMHGKYPYECGAVYSPYPLHIRNDVAKRYHDAGWAYVYHRVVSTKNLTSFILSMTPLDDQLADKSLWYRISKDYAGLLSEKTNNQK